jgi:hypothetical protein
MAQQLEAAELLLLDQGATAAGSSRPRSDATASEDGVCRRTGSYRCEAIAGLTNAAIAISSFFIFDSILGAWQL